MSNQQNDLISELISYARSKEYKNVITVYDRLSKLDKDHSKAIYYFAEALYEHEDDLGSLKAYCRFVSLYPNNRATDFAKMGIVACLKNLDLQSEAIKILQTVSVAHDSREKELKHSNEVIKMQFQAKQIVKKELGSEA